MYYPKKISRFKAEAAAKRKCNPDEVSQVVYRSTFRDYKNVWIAKVKFRSSNHPKYLDSGMRRPDTAAVIVDVATGRVLEILRDPPSFLTPKE